MIYIKLSRSEKPAKKFKVTISTPERGLKRTIHFGSRGASDFTKNKDVARKKRYISRHKARENWTLSGVLTPGFWSRWLLWNKPTLESSKRDLQNKLKNKFRIL